MIRVSSELFQIGMNEAGIKEKLQLEMLKNLIHRAHKMAETSEFATILDELLNCMEPGATTVSVNLIERLDPETLKIAIKLFLCKLPTRFLGESERLGKLKLLKALTKCLGALGQGEDALPSSE